MRIPRLSLIAATVLTAHAAAIVDVSTRTSLQMNPGDTLSFLLANLSLKTDVQTVRFLLVSQPVDPSLQFEAELTSRDGAESIPFPELQIVAGYLISSEYAGPVSAIFGTVTLPPSTSSVIWQNGRATLVLHDIGSTVTFGLQGCTLRDDLLATVQNGWRAAGAVVNDVLYQDPPPAAAPESDSWVMIGSGVAILGVFARALKRSSRTRIQSL